VTRIDPRTAFSTPVDAPLLPRFPMRFRDVLILSARYRTDPDAARSLVPEPLEPLGDEAIVHIYQMNDTDAFGAYNESAVQIPCVYPSTGQLGVYSPYLFLDNDGGVAAGREIYGQPKKFGLPTVEIRQDLVVGCVERNGIMILTVTMPYKIEALPPDEMFRRLEVVTNFNLKIVPAVDGGTSVRQLTARDLLDVSVHECWTGPATVELRPNAQAPMHRLPVREMLDGFLWRCDFTLDYGHVVHDYRAEGGPSDGEAAAARRRLGGSERT
jgi:acetoacetate decarboxylase